MKKTTISLLLFIAVLQLNAQGLQITGELKNIANNATVSLIDGMANKIVDSAKANGGKFVLKTKVENPSIYVISVAGLPQKLPVFVGNDNLKMSGDFQEINSITYAGSTTQDLYQVYMKTLTPKIESLFKSKQASVPATSKDSLVKAAEAQEADLVTSFTGLLKANNQSPVSTLFLLQLTNFVPSIKENIIEYYSLLQGDAKKGPFAAFIDKSVQSATIGKVGSVLPDFKQNDANGKSISLSSFRGKYVLVDFWASWCGPCRAENPNVVKAFNTYKNKNFTVLGVSLDQDKTKWLDAVKKDGLAWTQVSDLKYWNNEVAVQFGIQSIPANFLLNPAGVVIAKDVRGEELDRILAANLDK